MDLEFRSHYGDDPVALTECIRFARDMHGVDLSAWRDAGFWDPNYVPFSFFRHDRIVSSVSIYLLPMVMAGRRMRVPQISAVGTEPSYRRRGLNRELTDRALSWCRSQAAEYSFFFADEDAFPYYEKCGFRCTPQYQFLASLDPTHHAASSRLLNLDADEDRALLVGVAACRAPVSNQIGCLSINLLMFHALYRLHDCAYWIEDLGVVVFAKATDGVLRVFDIVGPSIPSWPDLLRYLPSFEAEQVEFMFMPDELRLESVRHVAGDDPDGTHIGGRGFPYETQPFRFPFTAQA